jgi:tetratricopeptide (TPR) repeat protein
VDFKAFERYTFFVLAKKKSRKYPLASSKDFRGIFMLKYVVSTVLCFGSAISCFSQEIPVEIELPFMTVHPSIAYAASGNVHLMLRDFELALEDFRKASICAEQSDPETAEAVEFFVLFGQAIAYDNLQLREKSEQSLSALILSLHEDDDEEEEIDYEDDEDSIEFQNEIFKMMLRLANLAPSDDIREILISIVESGWEEEYPKNIK